MRPLNGLPLPKGYTSDDQYVDDLLSFITTSKLHQQLVGGVHILDFFTCTPDLYERILSAEWRQWFDQHSMDELMDFFLREDVETLLKDPPADSTAPPRSLLEYIVSVRRLSLARDASPRDPITPMSRTQSMGMKIKKVHEVDRFARYVQTLTVDLVGQLGEHESPRLVDFGAGQGYLGRFLASTPCNRHVIAVEKRSHNVKGAKALDVSSNLSPKPKVIRNKKEYRASIKGEKSPDTSIAALALSTDADESSQNSDGRETTGVKPLRPVPFIEGGPNSNIDGHGSVQHVEHELEDGNLSSIINEISGHPLPTESRTPTATSELMVMGLHACGNLSHHALRSLILNEPVKAVAIVGCCYNLLTERLGPPTWKSENLRLINHSDSAPLDPNSAGDPHGFPMSRKLCEYPTSKGKGVQLNITARMMACQAPSNWGPDGSRAFFTRHYFRALLQKIFVQRGLVDPPVSDAESNTNSSHGRSPAGSSTSTQPVLIGSLGRQCYRDFVSYVRAAMKKLQDYNTCTAKFMDSMNSLSDDEIRSYADQFGPKKKHISIMWTLMAFSAVLVEACIVVDRWLWLREQPEVEQCWVEPVFDYEQSPRNLVVVGIKRRHNDAALAET